MIKYLVGFSMRSFRCSAALWPLRVLG